MTRACEACDSTTAPTEPHKESKDVSDQPSVKIHPSSTTFWMGTPWRSRMQEAAASSAYCFVARDSERSASYTRWASTRLSRGVGVRTRPYLADTKCGDRTPLRPPPH